jgi:hypothetical protein
MTEIKKGIGGISCKFDQMQEAVVNIIECWQTE